MKNTLKWRQPQNGNENNLKKEDNLINEDWLKIQDDQKNNDDLNKKRKMTSQGV